MQKRNFPRLQQSNPVQLCVSICLTPPILRMTAVKMDVTFSIEASKLNPLAARRVQTVGWKVSIRGSLCCRHVWKEQTLNRNNCGSAQLIALGIRLLRTQTYCGQANRTKCYGSTLNLWAVVAT